MSDTFPKSSTLGRGFKGQIQHRKGLNLVTTPSSQEGCSWQDYFAFDGLILSYQRQSTSVMFSMPFRADLPSFQPDFVQEMDTKWTRLYSFLSTWISQNLLYYFFDWKPWLVKCALVGKCFKKFEWSLNGFPVSNSQPYNTPMIIQG